MTFRNSLLACIGSVSLWAVGFCCALLFAGPAHESASLLPAIPLPEQADIAFRWIAWHNVRMVLYNVSGLLTFGSSAAINLLFNGLVFGMVISDALASGIMLSDILRHTLPHSIELLGLWLSGALGLYGIVFGLRYVKSTSGLSRHEIVRAIQIGLVSMFIIAIAAWLEVEFSIVPLLGNAAGGI